GTDVITLETARFDATLDRNVLTGALGNTLTVSGVETLTGSGGTDVVTLGSAGSTMTVVSGVEFLVGGAGTDAITLGSSGNTFTLRGIET
ncbi:hypothetical protein, partial [Azospirillum oleiclasticum]|nr:hypothetical protein [Azospirillum oleiclasticum]